MINTLSFSYPWWYILLCLALGVVYALVLYFKDVRFAEYSPWFTRGLAVLRALTVSIIALLLLSPFVKTVKDDIKKPIVVIATDKSASIAELEDNVKYEDQLSSLGEALGDAYEVKTIEFGSTVSDQKLDSTQRNSTNISGAFDYIYENYGDQNLGAIIIATDGIYNEGSNPVYMESKFLAPIYAIALGDTTQRKDLLFQNILHNKIAYLNDKIAVQVDISAFNCAGSNTNVTLEQLSGSGSRKIADANIPINSQNFFTTKTFIIDATSPGVQRYRVRMSSISGESNVKNNVKDFFIEVLDARQKILILANAPHPDVAALKNLITINKNYEVETAYAKDFNNNIGKFNLLILHNLPSDIFDLSSVVAQAKAKSIPLLYVVGMQTNLPRFNNLQNIVGVNGNGKNNEEVIAEINPLFSLFTVSDALKNGIKSFPPLITPFGEYKTKGNANVFLWQNIKKIKTNYPMLSFGEEAGQKITILCGEGLWRWRLVDYLQHKNYDLTSEIVNKVIQLTAIKEDKRKFRANTAKNIFRENESVIADAQLYNDSYEMINDPDVQMTIKDENNKEFKFTFNKSQNYYTLNAGVLSAGSYTYVASTNYSGKALTASGQFNVEAIQLEQFDMTARHSLLRELSDINNGMVVYPNEVSSLKDLILQNKAIKPVLYQSNATKSIINLRWIFFLLLGLLTVEWFLRRYFGSY